MLSDLWEALHDAEQKNSLDLIPTKKTTHRVSQLSRLVTVKRLDADDLPPLWILSHLLIKIIFHSSCRFENVENATVKIKFCSVIEFLSLLLPLSSIYV